MSFNRDYAKNLSNQFRSAIETRLDSLERLGFERFLQQFFVIKNLRNVQLWTRFGASRRDFINSRLGQQELIAREWIAENFIRFNAPNFPVKVKSFALEDLATDTDVFYRYYSEGFIREYATRIFIENDRLYLEYASDSTSTPDDIDLESPEFDDILEDEPAPPDDGSEPPSDPNEPTP